MVFTIIIASHYSSLASRLFGNNAVQVLATLFLLSYAKLFRVVITVFLSLFLIILMDFVCLLDGNIEFLREKHIPLFAFSLLMFTILSVPYTLSLVSRGVPRILAGGFLVVAKDIAAKFGKTTPTN